LLGNTIKNELSNNAAVSFSAATAAAIVVAEIEPNIK